MDTEIMKVPHFRVGDQRIRNRFQAWIEHKKTGQPLHFDLFNPLDLYKHPDIKSKMYALNLDISDLDRQRAILHPK